MKKILSILPLLVFANIISSFSGVTTEGIGYQTKLKLRSDTETSLKNLGYITLVNNLGFPVLLKAYCGNAELKSNWLNGGETKKYIRFDFGCDYTIAAFISTNPYDLQDASSLQQIAFPYAISVDNSNSIISGNFNPTSGICSLEDWLGIGKMGRTALPQDCSTI